MQNEWIQHSQRKFGKMSAQPHTIVKQVLRCIFLALFTLSKNWMHNLVWGYEEILPKILSTKQWHLNETRVEAEDMDPPFADLDSPTKLSFWTLFVSYLVTNSICKLFVYILFNHNTTFLNKGKEKQPFRSNSAAFIIASRTVCARQTTAFELLKFLQ